jgi:hypothetical protein
MSLACILRLSRNWEKLFSPSTKELNKLLDVPPTDVSFEILHFPLTLELQLA